MNTISVVNINNRETKVYRKAGMITKIVDVMTGSDVRALDYRFETLEQFLASDIKQFKAMGLKK